MRFYVIDSRANIPEGAANQAYLITDNWNDWFKYQTQYWLIIYSADGDKIDAGAVKIGQFGWREDQARPDIPVEFDRLNENFFSLGQDNSYYEAIKNLGDAQRTLVLAALRDIAADAALFAAAMEEEVTRESLLRSVSEAAAKGQYRRIAGGGNRLDRYAFGFKPKKRYNQEPPELTFVVEPNSQPPTNIHVLIGRNGVGKTHILQDLSRTITRIPEADNEPLGELTFEDTIFNDGDLGFSNLVSVTFSAFDPFDPLPEPQDKTKGFRYAYVGLKHRTKSKTEPKKPPKSPEQLGGDFAKSVRLCLQGARRARWERALEILESDPIFKQAELASLARTTDEDGPEAAQELAQYTYRMLSSGHKIVLLTLTRLVETVEERSLVLIDEPEAHLHPPLLSAFVRALSDLLTDRNGAAIIATHSPVILQEVPKSCAWLIDRNGPLLTVDRPTVETFGENVGILTREVFQLEVTHAGFHRLLAEAVRTYGSYDAVLNHFNNQLGGEAKAVARGLVLNQENGGEQDV